MAGLYIHIPFCVKRCIYCDFFSNTHMQLKEAYLTALLKEMVLRKDYIGEECIDTIYLGGGTPSQLSPEDLKKIFEGIHTYFTLSGQPEITLEANPDDLQPDYLEKLRLLPFNRISMGIQSFQDTDLKFLNRRHTAAQAIQAVRACKEYGYQNLSIDLIYELPGQTLSSWKQNIREAIRLEIPHLSAYHLTYEENTRLYKWKEQGKIKPVEEETSLAFFSTLIDKLTKAGFTHYEISNFAKPGAISRHNSAYWKGEKYIGLGPSAHSYNQYTRCWNVSSLPAYIRGMTGNNPQMEQENLDLYTRYNDYIITGLRTSWGIQLSEIEKQFGNGLTNYCRQQAATYIEKNLLTRTGQTLTLSRQGMFISDTIMSDLLWV
ncbi:MAG: radical SAM family heme chaperone HemW [Tannerellaceae bacterium]|nr:radical SAM family heme chaperone HemW [Tannerellaceae bacterium]